jgi:hypothetical protein
MLIIITWKLIHVLCNFLPTCICIPTTSRQPTFNLETTMSAVSSFDNLNISWRRRDDGMSWMIRWVARLVSRHRHEHAREVNHVRQSLHRPWKRFMDNDLNVTPPTPVVYLNRAAYFPPVLSQQTNLPNTTMCLALRWIPSQFTYLAIQMAICQVLLKRISLG